MCIRSLFHQIQNSIKDIVITKLLDKIISQDKEIEKYKCENEQLKFSLLLVFKQKIIEKTKFPLTISKRPNNLRLTFLSPNVSRSGINNPSCSKINTSQYSSNDTETKPEAKMKVRVNSLNKRNIGELTLSPSYIKPSIDYRPNNRHKKTSSTIHINVSTINTQKKTIEPHKQIQSNTSTTSSAKNIPKISSHYKTNYSLYSTPKQIKFSDSFVIHNKSFLGSSNGMNNKKNNNNRLFIKIHKKMISQVKLLNQKK